MSKLGKIHFATYFNDLKELLQNPGLIRDDNDLRDKVRATHELDDDLVTDLLKFCGYNTGNADTVLNWLHNNLHLWDGLQRTVDTYHANRLARQVIRLATKAPAINFETPDTPLPKVAANKTLSGPPSMATRQKALRELYSGNIDDLGSLLSRAFADTAHTQKITALVQNHLRGFDPAFDVDQLAKATDLYDNNAWFAENLTGIDALWDIALGVALYLNGLHADPSAPGKFTQASINNLYAVATEFLPRLQAVMAGTPLPTRQEPAAVLPAIDATTNSLFPQDNPEPNTVLPFVGPFFVHQLQASLVIKLSLEHVIPQRPTTNRNPAPAKQQLPMPQQMGELIHLTQPSPRFATPGRRVPKGLVQGAQNHIHTARGFMHRRF